MKDTSKYDIIIGLEMHIQTKTNSKIFCGCSANYFQKEPNTLVCPTCLGLPGGLPRPNRRAIELCILLGLATNCSIDNEIHFHRKHYSYPDLPKGYQISQYDRPICYSGYLDVKNEDNNISRVDIERIHQEEDVAKSTHHKEGSTKYTLIDYNKSGVSLIELVTRPNIKSAYEAKEFASKIRQILRYLNISDADMEKGQMRCEPNISVQEKNRWEYKDGKILPIGDYKLNPKVEIKNIGSISAVEKSINYEVDRLIKEIEEGKQIIQQTRGWDADRGVTIFQRSKESAEDYGYSPDPDIPIIDISKEDIERISKELVELPDTKKRRYITQYNLSEYDANVLTSDRDISIYYESVLKLVSKQLDSKTAPKATANWLTGSVFSIANENNLEINEQNIPKEDLATLIVEYEDKILTKNKAEELLRESIIEKKDLGQLLNEAKESAKETTTNLSNIIKEVINENSKAVEDFKGGKEASLSFLVGQVMQKTKGTADPNSARLLLIEKLNE